MLEAGRERLHAALQACERHLPAGAEFTRPRGGMSLWIRLPEPLDAGELLPRAEREGVTYLPGKYFAVTRPQSNACASVLPGWRRSKSALESAFSAAYFNKSWIACRTHAPIDRSSGDGIGYRE